MKVKCKTKNLKSAIQLHKKFKLYQQNIIFNGIMLKANEGSLEMYNTNLETGVKSIIESEVKETGTCLIPLKNFDNIVNCIDDDYIEIEYLSETNQCKIDNVKLNCWDIKEYPEQPVIPDNSITIKSLDFNDFKNAFNKVNDFYSTDESRVILTGVKLDFTNNCLVATDSYKLAISEFYFNRQYDEQVVIPGNLHNMFKTLKADKFDITIDVNCIYFTIGNQIIASRILHGKYPEYQKLIPTDIGYQYKIKSSDLIKSIDKCNKMLGGYKDNIPIKLNFNTVKVDIMQEIIEVGEFIDEVKVKTINKPYKYFKVISSDYGVESRKLTTLKEAEEYILNLSDDVLPQDYDNAEIREALEIDDFDVSIIEIIPDELLIAFNPMYLKDCIKNFDDCYIEAIEPFKPVLIHDNNNDYRTVLMPIRVS